MTNQLTDLMHRATENLEPVTPDLLERSVQRGLRLRRRRTTVLSLTGAGAVLATAGLIAGGVQLLGHASEASVAGTPVPLTTPTPAAKPRTVTPQQTLATLRSLIAAQGRTLSKPVARGGTPDDGFNAASFIVDDGKGISFVEVLIAGGGVQDLCSDPTVSCTTNPDGSRLSTMKEQPTYSDGRQAKEGVTSNYVTLSFPDGRFISLTSLNGPVEKGAKHTRQTPLFSVAELTAMVKSKAWKFPSATTVKPSGKAVEPSPTLHPTK